LCALQAEEKTGAKARGLRAPKKSAASARAANAAPDAGLLAARLESGEFGPAIDDAGKIDDLTERVGYLKQVVAAQQDAGEFQAAEATASRIPIPEQRIQSRREAMRQKGASGGGVQADFNSLMNLIQQTIQP